MPHKLLTYFDNRFERPPLKKYEQGPFITISRQTGCNGTGIAKDIAKALKAYGQKWSFINKEVLEESARKLKIDPSKIKYVFETKRKTHFDDVISALSSRYYKSDKVVRKTITEVLRHYAQAGHVILVGRAGIATTADINRGLHIRFTAPYEWRVNNLKKRKAFESRDVGAFIKEHDLKKRKLIEDFCGKDISDIHFDLTLNCETFTRQQIIELVVESLKMKKFI